MRAVINADIPLIMSKLRELRSISKAPHMQFVDEMEAELYIFNAVHNNGHNNGPTKDITDTCQAVIADGYFIMFTVGPMWCTKANFLIEDMVIRIDDGPSPEVVPQVLLALKERFNCVAAIGGDSQGGYMAKYYQKAGWVQSGSLFMGT